MEEEMTTGDPSIKVVRGIEATSKIPWYRQLDGGRIFYGDRFSEGLDQPIILASKEISNSSSTETFYELNDLNNFPDIVLKPDVFSPLLGLEKWLPPNPNSYELPKDLNSELSKSSLRGKRNFQTIKRTFFWFAFVLTVSLSAVTCFKSWSTIEEQELRIKFLENKLEKLSERIETDSSKIADTVAAMEEKIEKQIRLALNTIHGAQCKAVAYNCAWNLVTTTPGALLRKMALLD